MATIARPMTATPALVIMLTAAMFLSYSDRGLLALAGPQLKGELGLTATSFGLAVSAFYWVYGPGQFLTGWLVDRFSVYRLFAAGIAISALATLLQGMVTGLVTLVAIRVLLGIGQSFSFTGSSKMIACHCGQAHRGSANGSIGSGIGGGQALGAFVGGFIMAAYGWRAMCILFGLITFAWLLPWSRVRPDRAEKDEGGTFEPVPFREILEKKAVHFSNNYGFYFLITWLPLYLVTERGLSIELMATLTGLTYAVETVAALALGWLSDHFIRLGYSESRVRKGFQGWSQVAKAASILGIALSDSQAAMISWLVVAGIAFGVAHGQNFVIPQLFAGPRACGRWVGLQNGTANFAGIVGPVITGLVIDSTGDYWAAFALASAVTFVGAILWGIVLPPVQPVQWRSSVKEVVGTI
jgi:MFS family permease